MLSNARVKTYVPVTEWMRTPLLDLLDWLEDINQLSKKIKK